MLTIPYETKPWPYGSNGYSRRYTKYDTHILTFSFFFYAAARPLLTKIDVKTSTVHSKSTILRSRIYYTPRCTIMSRIGNIHYWTCNSSACYKPQVMYSISSATGDINQRAPLTHIGKYQARACATAIIARAHGTLRSSDNSTGSRGNSYDPWSKWVATADHVAIPQVIFTDHQIASVGLTEEGARSLKMNVRAVDYEFATLQAATLHTDGYTGRARIIVNEDRHVLVGATFTGRRIGASRNISYNR
jgi:Pyridine nucleotide-disulphide oxidoreductase, dimerisation domain